ncbi:MAG: hypothetical protein NTY71_01850 [Methanoregula sp.]|jgi:uncharacterized protein HemY|nr:hypothetical protein [Methanoregula sp.]
MDSASIKKWLVFFCGIFVAIIIADQLSNVIVAASGISGWSKIPVSFILYAVLFIAILYAIGVFFGIGFFDTNRYDR